MKIVIFAYLALLFGVSLSSECYERQKVWLILRVDGKGKVFERRDLWILDGNSTDELSRRDVRWFARHYDGLLTDDSLLQVVGQVELARRIRQMRESAARRSTVQLVIGLPLGLGMVGGCVYWGTRIWGQETPSTIDLAGAIVLGTAGIGVLVGVVSAYIRHHSKPSPTEHEISLKQASDIVDRYNSALKRQCEYSENN